MKKIMMTRLSVCSLGVSCNEMIDTPILLVVHQNETKSVISIYHSLSLGIKVPKHV